MIPANVKLSKSELIFVCDEHIILTKNKITEKVYSLFGLLSSDFSLIISEKHRNIPEDILLNSAKIYRGEQYKGLPYIMLDYPRCFTRDSAFAIRCFFWWGNFFSITLHLSGKYAAQFGSVLINHLREAEYSEWYLCINESQWEQNFEMDKYIAADIFFKSGYEQDTIGKKGFIKIAKKIPLHNWEESFDFFTSCYDEILTMLRV